MLPFIPDISNLCFLLFSSSVFPKFTNFTNVLKEQNFCFDNFIYGFHSIHFNVFAPTRWRGPHISVRSLCRQSWMNIQDNLLCSMQLHLSLSLLKFFFVCHFLWFTHGAANLPHWIFFVTFFVNQCGIKESPLMLDPTFQNCYLLFLILNLFRYKIG